MRNVGLKNSNYCMTVVGVAPPLHMSCKNFLYSVSADNFKVIGRELLMS